jgi:aryl-alcohol dehydrogenase-like predicted oxidoreductase
MMQQTSPFAATGRLSLGGDLSVSRLGLGTMRLTGPGTWGPPADKQEALRLLRRAIELGITFIDTADSYGPEVSEQLIAEALFPYSQGMVIATKGGFQRPGPDQWVPDGRPEHLRAAVEGSLKRLRLERIEVYHFHNPDPRVRFEASIETLARLREAGKIRHIGLSNVDADQLALARQITPIISVQNRYNLLNRDSADLVDLCEREGLAFIPWFPLAAGALAHPGGVVDRIAKAHRAPPSQIALAWLLRRSRTMLPIPGTSKVAHLEESVAAANIQLSEREFQELSALRP